MARPHFRAGVVAVVRDQAGKILAFERVDNRGQWQLPQGGIDAGETPEEAVWRELKEETGLTKKSVTLVDEYPYWTIYQWPANVPRAGRYGQAHRWFFFEPKSELKPKVDGKEFRDWKWMKPRDLIDGVVSFRRQPYEQVLGG